MTGPGDLRIVSRISMPNKHAAIKDLGKNIKRAARNERMKKYMHFLLKKCVAELTAGNMKEAKTTAQQFQQAVDKAAKNHVIMPSKAARKKSTLMKAVAAKK